jgi:hypothetical protein
MKRIVTAVASRVYGGLCLLNGAAVAAVWLSNYRSKQLHEFGGHDLSGLQYVAVISIAIGIALVLKQLWAQLIFVAAATLIGAWVIVGSFLSVQFPWMLIDLALGGAFLIPLFVSFSTWRGSHSTALHGA